MAENEAGAVLGTGIMGAAMARNLVSAGMDVRVWNRTREKVEPLADDGARVTESPSEAADGAGFLLTMLSDADAVERAVGDGTLGVLADSGIWIQTSTAGIKGNERLAEIAASNGVLYVDAPVLGTKQPAEAGQLVVLASGPDEVRERCEPIFTAIGSKTFCSGRPARGPASSSW